jgi:hypothetical protein
VAVPNPDRLPDDVELAQDTYLGVASQYIVREDAVRPPENAPEVLATPAEVERLDSRTYRMAFHIRDIDWSEASGERIELGLGTFRSLDFHQRCIFDVVPVEPFLWCGVEITHPPNKGKVTLGGNQNFAPTTWGKKVPVRLNGGSPEAKLTFKANSTGIELPGFPPYLNCRNNWTLKWDYRQYAYTNGQLQPQSWVTNVETGSPITLWLEDDQCAPRWYDVRVRAVTNQGTVVASDTNEYGINIVGC